MEALVAGPVPMAAVARPRADLTVWMRAADSSTRARNAVRSARSHGAAVLWTVTDAQIWNYRGIHATTRAKMFGSELRALAGSS